MALPGSLSKSLSIALRALGRNKLQTALTMLGMTIGVGAVLTMVALGSGAQASIEQQVRAAGMNLIVVTAGNYKTQTEEAGGGVVDHQAALEWRRPDVAADGGLGDLIDPNIRPASDWRVRPAAFHPEDDPMEKHDHPTASQRLGDSAAGLGAAATLTFADAEAIRKQVPGVQYVSPGIHENARVASGDDRWFTRLHGTDMALPLIRRAWSFSRGRFFSQREQTNAAQVIVIGSVVASKLYADGVNPVGSDIKLWNQSFTVVGVISSTSMLVAPAPGDDQFDAIYVPFTTVQKLLNLTKLNDITITAESSGEVTRVAKDVTELLRFRHNIGLADPDDFTVKTQARQMIGKGGMRPEVARAMVGNVSNLEKVTLEQLAKTLERASQTMTALLASIAGVSLLVGGIGIMNIMLLSVTERTREIGIRRAVGAKAGDVLLQFLVEAIAISIAGGLAGIALGVLAAVGITQWLQWSTTLSPWAVALAFGTAAAVGIFFGYYPARQASRLDPIESLRYE